MAQTLRYDIEDLKKAVETMQNGGVILYPTDTVWGIGCDARNETAVQRIFNIKQRDDSKSMLILLEAPGKLQGYVKQIPDMAWDLMEYSVRPLTIIYPGGQNIAKNLIANDGSVGIRVTKDIFCQELCRRLKAPIVSTSANISGKPAATTFSTIDKQIISAVDYVVQFRQNDNRVAEPSSIIKLEINNEFKLIR